MEITRDAVEFHGGLDTSGPAPEGTR
jgi:hypothetical protein